MTDPVATGIGLPFEESIRYFNSKANRTSTHFADVWGKAHTKAFAVAGAATDAIVDDFREAVRRAITDGESLQQFRKRFDAIKKSHGWEHAGTPGWRSRVIFEANLGSAYAAGRYVQMTEPATVAAFPFWQYVHSGKKHFREQHKRWNGTVLRADDPFWSWAYPPNGYHCGCWVRPLTANALGRQGRTGTDPSPPRERTQYLVKKTGELKPATVGIDPGWDQNPGEEWLKIRNSGGGPAAPAPSAAAGPATAAKPAAPPWQAAAAPGSEGIDPVDSELRAAYAAWKRSLTDDQIEAIRAYKGSGFASMNGHLRKRIESAPGYIVEQTRQLDGALSRASMPRDIELHRGVTGADPFHSLQEGQSVRYNAFASFSASSHKARVFASGEKRVIVVARVGKGYKGAAYIHDVPIVIHTEYEVLFRPGSTFRCVERTETDREIRIVVEAINEPRRRARLAPRRVGEVE